jgi:rhodanese-related sulfurtransferase
MCAWIQTSLASPERISSSGDTDDHQHHRPIGGSLDPDEQIVVYCTSDDCHASVTLYHALVDAGYKHVRRYSGGLTDWEAAGLPLEGEWVDSARG